MLLKNQGSQLWWKNKLIGRCRESWNMPTDEDEETDNDAVYMHQVCRYSACQFGLCTSWNLTYGTKYGILNNCFHKKFSLLSWLQATVWLHMATSWGNLRNWMWLAGGDQIEDLQPWPKPPRYLTILTTRLGEMFAKHNPSKEFMHLRIHMPS